MHDVFDRKIRMWGMDISLAPTRCASRASRRVRCFQLEAEEWKLIFLDARSEYGIVCYRK
jgi:hypothetical protein